jgi:hypothetical protein
MGINDTFDGDNAMNVSFVVRDESYEMKAIDGDDDDGYDDI